MTDSNMREVRFKPDLEDRLSDLPDPLILRIFSFLPIREVIIGTSTLSKRLQHLWTQVPNLIFDTVSSKQISLVTQTLALRRGSKIDNLSLDLRIESGFSHLDQLIDLTTACNVESLDLSLRAEDVDCALLLPEQLCTSPSLRKLRIEFCFVGTVRWNSSLNSLSIHECEFDCDKMSQILSGCPVLEYLEMVFVVVEPIERFILASKSIRKLKFHSAGDEDALPVLLMPSLVDASLSFHLGDFDVCQEMRRGFQEVLGSLGSVENLKLTISSYCPVLSMERLQAFPSQLVNCKFLTLKADVQEWEFPGIANLLQTVPNLEMLDLKFCFVPRFCNSCEFDGNDAESRERFSKFSLDHLKLVTIYINEAQLHEFDVELIQFVLMKARVLEKMIIYPKQEGDKSDLISRCRLAKDLLQTATMLLSLPRSSPNAAVKFMSVDPFG